MRFSQTRPVKIVQLGAGGTGGHIAPHLYRLLYSLDRPVRYIICDGDVVEQKNLVRQNFTPADLGENKAQVLAERYSSVFGMETEYVPDFVEDEDRLKDLLIPMRFRQRRPNSYREEIVEEMVILLGAVDNNKSRQLCHRVFTQAKELIYIDSGNGEYTGQVVCGVRRGGRTCYPPIGTVYPDVLEETDKFPTELSCAVGVGSPEHGGQHHRRHRCGRHDLQHSGRGREYGAENHLFHPYRQYPARDSKNKKEERSVKATVDAKEFSQALNKVIKVIKQASIPELEGVLVSISNDRCTLTATDFTTWLTTTIPARGDDLSFVFQRPKDAARACGHFEGELILEAEEKSNHKTRCIQLTMSCGPRAAQMDAFLPEDYPAMREEPARYTYTVNAARLLERVEHVKYALRKPDDKLEAQRTHVQFDGNKVFAVDGYRLAWDVDEGLAVRQPFMVLPEALKYLKMFGNQEVTASVGEWYLQVTDGTTELQTRIGGPLVFNVDGAVPKEFKEEFCVWPEEFLRELDYLKNLTRSIGSACVRFSGGKLSMLTPSGGYCTQIQIDGESSIDFGFELRYMIDALRQFRREPQVKLKVINPVAPIILEAEGRSDFAMVLPVRMKQAAAA